jgi:hypothetical protein
MKFYPMMRIVKIALVVAVGGILSSCSPVKGYSGPDLPETKISHIRYVTPASDEVSVEAARTGPYTFTGAGINVLPGNHRIDLDLQVKAYAPGYNCRYEHSFNNYGYQSCLKESEKKNYTQSCDCFDYLSIYKVCQVEVSRGSCAGEIISKAGGKYTIEVRKDGMRGAAYCLSCGLGGPVTFTCGDFYSSFVEERDYIGTGRSNAHSAGIYSCGNY